MLFLPNWNRGSRTWRSNASAPRAIRRPARRSGHVPGATSSFYFKGKQISVADIAKTLGVRYVLDGSVRKSGPMLRVAARLIRADSGYVVWSETYDRPFKDKIWVQDDIASEVTKALRTSIQAAPDRK